MTPAQLQDRLESRAGVAVARLQATAVQLAAAIDRDPSLISQWRSAGTGPLGKLLRIVHAWESRGIDCTPLIEAMIDVQMRARGVVPMCPKALAREETQIDSEEDAAQVAYLTGQPGALVAWRDSLVRYVAFASRALRSLEVRNG